MAVYGQPKMLAKQLETFESYPNSVHEELKLIVVDDHGDPPVRAIAAPYEIEVYRILDDIPWNQMGARNLGMHHAKGPCVMVDADMVFRSDMIEAVVDAANKMKKGTFIKYGIKHKDESTKGIDMTSPSTFILHRDDFFGAGGYDEDYRGNKGWSDVQMQEVLHNHYKMIRRPDLWCDIYNTNFIEDAVVRWLERSVGHNKKIHLKKLNQAKRIGWKRWVKEQKGPNLRFRWERVI